MKKLKYRGKYHREISESFVMNESLNNKLVWKLRKNHFDKVIFFTRLGLSLDSNATVEKWYKDGCMVLIENQLSNALSVSSSKMNNYGLTNDGAFDSKLDLLTCCDKNYEQFIKSVNTGDSDDDDNVAYSQYCLENQLVSDIWRFSENAPFLALEHTLTVSDSFETHNNQHRKSASRHRNHELFSMDICSLVGQNYLHLQTNCSYSHCNTSMSYDMYCQWPQNEGSHRLRPRIEPYAITFKRDANSEMHVHLYKFSGIRQIQFGHNIRRHRLSRKSKKLLQQMCPCVVQLSRLSAKSFLKYFNLRQPVVCFAQLSRSVIMKWAGKEQDFSQKNLYKRVEKFHGSAYEDLTNLRQPVVLLKRDFQYILGDEGAPKTETAKYPVLHLNQLMETASSDSPQLPRSFYSVVSVEHTVNCMAH